MEINKFYNLKKCGEILLDIKSKTKKNKIFIFHCAFCEIECDQLKKFSLHIEEHLYNFEDSLEEIVKVEVEPEQVHFETVTATKNSDSKNVNCSEEQKTNTNPDPLDTLNDVSNVDILNYNVKNESINNSNGESIICDRDILNCTPSIVESDIELKEEFETPETSINTRLQLFESDDDYSIDGVSSKERKINHAKKSNRTKLKIAMNEMSSDESKDADSNVEKESNAIKKHKRCKKRWEFSSFTSQIYLLKMDQINNEISSLKAKIDTVLKCQDEIVKSTTENNVLLKRNMGIYEVNQTIFPIESKSNLKKIEVELSTDKRHAVIGLIKRILSDDLKNIHRIFGKNIISNYNYDGIKGKKSLKNYNNILNAIYESTKVEGQTYEEFIKKFRLHLHRFKNTINRANSRKEKNLHNKINIENK